MESQNFQSLQQLTAYLEGQNQRISALEEENKKLMTFIASRLVHKEDILETVEEVLPKTGVISPRFMKRAFSIWGHYFVAQLIIGAGIGLAYLVFTLVLNSLLVK